MLHICTEIWKKTFCQWLLLCRPWWRLASSCRWMPWWRWVPWWCRKLLRKGLILLWLSMGSGGGLFMLFTPRLTAVPVMMDACTHIKNYNKWMYYDGYSRVRLSVSWPLSLWGVLIGRRSPDPPKPDTRNCHLDPEGSHLTVDQQSCLTDKQTQI